MSSISRSAKQLTKLIFLTALLISLAFSVLPAHQMANSSKPSFSLPRASNTPLALAPVASAAPYDEQVGITFTQDFSKLAFNVSAVAFTDNGIGPGYLVNGLTDRGYWYQVGLSYNWPRTDGSVNPGFSMNYEVFDPGLVSIYPSNGGGIQLFNGTVNTGDSVLLSLSFSQGIVVMRAVDWQTRSTASQSFTAYAYTEVFKGLTSSLAQSGFFSGLMTEQYHYYPYHGAGQPVTYSVSGAKLSSAWMWMDEWNTYTGQLVFDANTSALVLLSESVGHYFSSNGTSEVASAHGLVTGLTPVIFPSLLANSQSTGQPGHRDSIRITIADQDGATVRFDNLTVSTSFGRYNFTLGTVFSFGAGLGQYNLTIDVPASLALGSYNLTIDVTSWAYLDTQAQVWVPLKPSTFNETLLLRNSPPPPSNPPNNPGSSPPSSTQGPSRSTNNTTFSAGSLLAALRSTIVPIVGGYAAMGLLAIGLFLRQQRRRSRLYSTLGLRFCSNCRGEISPETIVCHHCNFLASGSITNSQLLPPKQEKSDAVG